MSRRYVDPVAVEKVVSGYRVHVRPIERRAAIHELTRRGLTASRIAMQVGVTKRTVQRNRAMPKVEVSAFG